MPVPLSVFIDEHKVRQSATVGAFSVVNPASLQGILFRARVKHLKSSREEVKWSNLTPFKAAMAREMVRNFYWYRSVRMVLQPLGGVRQEDVEQGIIKALSHFTSTGKVVAVFMDWFDNGPGYNFDNLVKKWFRPAVVLRLDSRANDILQMLDVVFNVEIAIKKQRQLENRVKLDLIQYYKEEVERYRKYRQPINGPKLRWLSP